MSSRPQPLKMGNHQVQGLADGVDATDAVNKGQLDAAIATVPGTVTSVALSGGTTGLTVSGSPITSSGTITLAGTIAVANGGTGLTTLTSNNVILGNGTGNPTFVAPGTSGNILTSNGTTWQSVAPVPEWTIVKKTTGQTISLSATLTDDNVLQFAMEANKTYAIRISLAFSFITGGYQYGITGPSSPTSVRWGTSNAYGLIGSGGTNGQQIVWLTVKVENGANAGNFKVQFCQSSGAAGSITMENGSYLEYREIS